MIQRKHGRGRGFSLSALLPLIALVFNLLQPSAVLADTSPLLGSYDQEAASLNAAPSLPAPSGITVAEDGTVYVTDYTLDHIIHFGTDGTVLSELGTSGTGLGQLSGPFGVALDANGTLYVAEQLNNRLQRFAPDGTPLGIWGAAGAEPGQLRTPFCVTIANGRLYVADFGNDRLQIYTLDGSLLRTWGSHGSNPGQFQRPVDVAVDTAGGLYVSDYFNNRVQHLLPDGHTIQVIGASAASLTPTTPPLATFTPSPTASPSPTAVAATAAALTALVVDPNSLAGSGSGSTIDSSLLSPEGVALDASGNLLVVDSGHNRVVRFSPDGRLLGVFGRPNADDAGLAHPKGIAVDPNSGRIYVADTGNNRVVSYAPDGTFGAAWALPIQ